MGLVHPAGTMVRYDGTMYWYSGTLVWYDGMVQWYNGMVQRCLYHICTEAQRAKYIEQRCENPSLRMRCDDQLGPRTEVKVTRDTTSSLEKPSHTLWN